MRSLAAEFIGTFAIVFFGTGAAGVEDLRPVLGNAGVCAVFGLTVAAMIYALGEISGAHFNPAVSFGFWLAGRMSAAAALRYSAVQFLGAAGASLLLRAILPGAHSGSTHPLTADLAGILQSLILEAILTFFLMFVILRVSTGSKEKGITAGLAIGFTVALCALMGGPISGASMNPARSFGPALARLDFGDFWIYIVGPLSGAAFAALTERIFTSREENR